MDGDDVGDKTSREARTAADIGPARGAIMQEQRDTTRARHLDSFELLELLGRGGMGEVYAARDEALGREIAIKRVLGTPSPDVVKRFIREARIQGSLEHPSVPPVHQLGFDHDGNPYLVMKKLSGTTLSAILDRAMAGDANVKVERLLRALSDVCLAVELAHTRGVIHRDLKPSNIMLGEFGEVYVLDWGVAKVIGDNNPAFADLWQRSPESDDDTLAGAVVGTPGYIAPEQLLGHEVDARADVYALGCTLRKILRCSATRDGSIPPELDVLCTEACEDDPTRRLASPRELGERLRRYLDGDRDLALRRALAREHLAKAHAALADGDPTQTAAMREAGRALALDPELAEASQLVSRLMLEPPKQLPPEAERMFAGAEVDAKKRHVALIGFGALLYLAFVPVFVWIGTDQFGTLSVLFALVAALGLAAFHAYRRGIRTVHYVAASVGTGAVIAWFSWHLTPVLFAPGLGVITVMVLAAGPAFRRIRYAAPAFVMVVLGIGVPWLAQAFGWVPTTMSLTGTTLRLDLPLLAGTEPSWFRGEIGLVLWSLVIVFVSGVHAHILSRSEQSAREQLYFQAWRLKQLSPVAQPLG